VEEMALKVASIPLAEQVTAKQSALVISQVTSAPGVHTLGD